MINPIDLFIIYLACGAPFGVYYFLKNRARTDLRMLWLGTFFNFLFWIPFALLLARRNSSLKVYINGFDRMSETDAVQEKNIFSIQKDIERVSLENRPDVSVYELRETIERYVGLTLAEKNDAKKIAEHEKEIFRLAPTKNVELGSICLRRRNRKRLSFHQIAARKDFLRLINRMSESVSDTNELAYLSVALTKLTEDFEAQSKLEKMFAGSMPNVEYAAVKNVEKDLWNPETHRPPLAQPISRLQAAKATMNLRGKD